MALVATLALWVRPAPIESDLDARAGAALQAVDASWATIVFDGRDATLRGVAETEADRMAARRTVADIWGVRAVVDATTLPVLADPFIWTLERGEATLRISGHVPSLMLRRDSVEAIRQRFPDFTITDDTEIARGVNDLAVWRARIDRLVDALAGLAQGTVSLTGDDGAIVGQAATSDAYQRYRTLEVGNAFGDGIVLSQVEVMPPPVAEFIWSARWDGTTITLDGTTPSETTRSELNGLAAAAFPDAVVIDEMVTAVSDTGPEDLPATVAFAFAQLGGVVAGEISLRDRALSLTGRATSIDDYERILSAVEMLPGDLVRGDVSLQPAQIEAFFWRAERTEDGLTLSGLVPSEVSRRQIESQATTYFPNLSLNSSLRLAEPAGLSEVDWDHAYDFGLIQLSGLEAGSIALDRDRLSISGRAQTPEAYASIKDALRELPRGLRLMRDAVIPALVDDAGLQIAVGSDRIDLSGFFLNEARRDAVLSALTERFPNQTIADGTGIAEIPITDDIWQPAMDLVLDAIVRLQEATATFDQTMLVFSGRARSVEDFEWLQSLADVPGLTLDVTSILPPLADSFAWAAEKSASGLVTLEAIVSSVAERDAFVSEAGERLDAEVVEIRLVVAEAPDGGRFFDATVDFSRDLFALLTEGSVIVRDGVADIRGVAADLDRFNAALDLAESGLPTGIVVGRLSLEPAEITELSWAASNDGRAMTIQGFVPSEAVRSGVLEMAGEIAGDLPVVDRMGIASGGTEAAIWAGATQYALTQLGRLETGRVALDGTAFSISGTALDAMALDALMADVPGALPGGLRLVSANVLPPRVDPYVWGLSRDDISLTVSGTVPDEQTRRAILDRLAEKFPSLTVIDEMALGSGNPPNWPAAISVAISQAERLVSGEVRLEGTDMVVVGEVWTDSARQATETSASGALPPGYRGVTDVSVRPIGPPVIAEECQTLLNEALTGRTILFETGSATISGDSFALLDQITSVMARCPDAQVEVAGHTDSIGNDDDNLRLSEARAEAVRGYLATAGVAEDRLTARGYGETAPIATNDTADGRRQNRRIEFTVEL
ncbi:MAG: OmpA family protein [Pseudomonadota bacterium]